MYRYIYCKRLSILSKKIYMFAYYIYNLQENLDICYGALQQINNECKEM